jgi:hypothetical protein
MFSCKKDNDSPVLKGKEIEISGQVFDTYLEQPIKDVNIIVTGWDCKNTVTACQSKEVFKALTDSEGRYKMKFFAFDSLDYYIYPEHEDYVLFEYNTLRCCSKSVTYNKLDGSRTYNLTDSFYMHKKGQIELNIKNANCPPNDSLMYYILVNYKSGQSGEIYNHIFPKLDFIYPYETLADNMNYIYWKRGSEKDWHNDSIFTPFGKIPKFNIEY